MGYDPFEHAHDLGIEVIHRPIRTANGLWLPDHNTIVLKTGMRRILERSVLAHELGHASLGHRDDRPKHEIQADRFAGDHLIDAARLAELVSWVQEPNRLALELGVTHRILRTYLNTHRALRVA